MKILTHHAHGTYQTELSKVPGVEFYHVVDTKGVFQNNERPKRGWGDGFSLPHNVHIIEATDVREQDYDCMLIHWHPLIESFCTRWSAIPTIFLEHTWPKNNSSAEIQHWKSVKRTYCRGVVFITPSSLTAWGEQPGKYASYIYHSINLEEFPQKIDYTGDSIVTLTNEFIKRDWACGFQLWVKVLGLPKSQYFSNICLYGDGNQNLGRELDKGPLSREKVLDVLLSAGAYFNPSLMSPIPMSVLEAVAVGTPLVSTAYCEVGRLFKNGVHGVITNDPIELRAGLIDVLNDPEKYKVMSIAARDVVKTTFSPLMFRTRWREIFERVVNGK